MKVETLRLFYVWVDCKYHQMSLYDSRCLKITEKVLFDIASEASYVYILSGQKFTKNAKNGQFVEVMEP